MKFSSENTPELWTQLLGTFFPGQNWSDQGSKVRIQDKIKYENFPVANFDDNFATSFTMNSRSPKPEGDDDFRTWTYLKIQDSRTTGLFLLATVYSRFGHHFFLITTHERHPPTTVEEHCCPCHRSHLKFRYQPEADNFPVSFSSFL